MVERASDVLIIGGGIIGLAIALELQSQGASVTLLSREFQAAASHAAAGMLAPRAEGILPGPMLDLCLRSLALYPAWVRKIELLSGQSVGYWPSGILAPRFAASSDPRTGLTGEWLEPAQLPLYQSGLSSDLQGGWWFPEDGQVDNQALTRALRLAVQDSPIRLHEGVTVTGLHRHQGRIERVCTDHLGDFVADHVVLATGAWSHQLVPIPVVPRKGEMACLRVPPGYDLAQPLQRVLFGESIYIVPRQDGRIILGATSQDVGFTPHNTPAGLHWLMGNAMALFPELANFPMEDCWWGFRPATPDHMPLLGSGPSDRLILATGHYRNGILLAPVTATLISDALQGRPDPLLDAFSWRRFQPQSGPLPPASRSISSSPALSEFSFAMPTLQTTTSVNPVNSDSLADTPLVIAGHAFHSRLMTGTGKYDDFEVMRQTIAASGCEIVTVAVRRVQTNAPGHEGLADALDWSKIWMLPNTAGCKTAEEAVRVARLGREMAKLLGQEDNNFVKLEVIPDAKYLLPDPIGTLAAAEQLVKEGFAVLPYINADPLLAKRLEEAGCATVMPLGSPIGSGQGIRNRANIEIIIENASVPVVVDAGIGTPSEAAEAMEIGADALLINTAIAKATNPIAMGRAMGLAAQAGRLAYQAGRIPVRAMASASSPLTGRITE